MLDLLTMTITMIHKNFRFKIHLLVLLIILMTACKKPVTTFEDEALLNKLYSISVDTLTLQNNDYILETYLSRDFFPGIGIGKKSPPLVADIYLVNIDSVAIPSYLDIKKLYIIQGQLIWESTPIDGVQSYVPDFKINKLGKNGPNWDTDISVDAIIMIVNNLTKEEYYLIARNQYIIRTE
jgi:hypothetical protein